VHPVSCFPRESDNCLPRLADVATVTSPALVQAVDASSLEVVEARVGDTRRALALAAVLAVERSSAFHVFSGTWQLRNLLVQEAGALHAIFEGAGGLDGAVESGWEGVCGGQKSARVRGYFGGYGCY
jgi:hypothetical protein